MSGFLTDFCHTVAELDPNDTTDELCCIFAQDWTRKVYGAKVVDAVPVGMWRLFPELKDPWSPVQACFHAGVAEVGSRRTDGALTPGRWHRVQGWRGTPFAPGVTGHTFTVYCPTNPSTTVLVFDSANRLPARGERVAAANWVQYVAQYKGGTALCVLKEPT